MTLSFYLVCFGILGCYAGLRTVKAGWAKGLISIVLVVCLIHLSFEAFYPKTRHADKVAAAELHGPRAGGGGFQGYLAAKMDDWEADRCVLEHLEQTPLSPIVYVIELHSFLNSYKKMQAAQMSGTSQSLGNTTALFMQSFNQTAPALTPEETAAIEDKPGGKLESLCNAFGKWTDTLATHPEAEQRQVWDSLQSAMDDDQ